MSSHGIGLGLDFGSVGINELSSRITPEADTTHAVPTIHPAYIVHPPARSIRGPRSMGVGKRFVSAPSPTLPPTLYDRTPLNPLSMSNPVNSPQLDMGLVHISPAQHLKQMKKRSFAARTAIDGLTDALAASNLNGEIGANSSPTIAASPTMAAASPVVSSPVPDTHSRESMMASSIALSVMLGLLFLGVAGWATYRRVLKTRLARDEIDEDFDGTQQNHNKTFAASNVVEKGLKPRSSSFVSESTIHPSVLGYQPTLSNVGHTGRRVSFIDTEPAREESYGNMQSMPRRYSIAPPRVMIATLSGDGPEYGEEYEMDVADARLYGAPRHSNGVIIAPSLEPIEEEGSLKSSSSDGDISVIQPRAEEHTSRRSSVASTASSSSSNASAYTTASARSSISSLSALSIISSAFPQTPRDLSTPPGKYQYPAQTPTSPTDSPTPSSKFHARRVRAQSQTVVSVKHADVLRTAVGRTMSLQPTKEVLNALKRMTAVEPFEEEITAEALEEMRLVTLVAEKLEADVAAENDSPEVDSRIESEHEESGELQAIATADTLYEQTFVPRSTSFPAKLLSRRRSQHNSTIAQNPSRRSEVIPGNYLKRALRTFRNDDEGAAVPVLPSSIPMPMSSPSARMRHEESIARLAERQAQLEVYLAAMHRQNQPVTASQTSTQHRRQEHAHGEEEQLQPDADDGDEEDVQPEAEVWDPEAYTVDGGAFDEYYLHYEGAADSDADVEVYRSGDMADEDDEEHQIEHEEEDDFPSDVHEEFGMDSFPLPIPQTHLPHIRVTSH